MNPQDKKISVSEHVADVMSRNSFKCTLGSTQNKSPGEIITWSPQEKENKREI